MKGVEETETACEVCGVTVGGLDALAEHLVTEARASDGAHIMWLNRGVTKYQVEAAELAVLLRHRDERRPTGEERVKR
jgi:hypothetical protein